MKPLLTRSFRGRWGDAFLCPGEDAGRARHTPNKHGHLTARMGGHVLTARLCWQPNLFLKYSWCQLPEKMGFRGGSPSEVCLVLSKSYALWGHSLLVPLAKETRLILFLFIFNFCLPYCSFKLPKLSINQGKKKFRTCQVIVWVKRSLEKLSSFFHLKESSDVHFVYLMFKKQRGIG